MVGVLVVALALAAGSDGAHRDIGIFEGHGDVGAVTPAGQATFQADEGTYTVTAAGENMWATTDAFHYVWKKVGGDVALTADIAFPKPGKNPHRKACLVIRQSLDADSAYADIARHGDGLTSLQFRDSKGGTTHEVQSNVSAPMRVRIERRGAYVSAFVSRPGGGLQPSGGSVRLELKEPFYIGIGVCSHEKDVSETAVFSDVDLESITPPDKPKLYSTIETVAIASTDRRTVSVFAGKVGSPNWTPDGKHLVVDSQGLLFRIPAAGGQPAQIDTGFANWCTNYHGLSPDGKTIVFSDQSQGDHQSAIYTVPFSGGTPKRVTDHTPSYWHGWSPDGKTLAYCAQRDSNFGVFTIPVEGGQETRLTTAVAGGIDDGPEYSPDGKHIYFNSDRTGKMQIHRMRSDGTGIEQLTKDEYNNWWPHVSPDGKWVVFLTYAPDEKGHVPDKDVMLRLINLADGKVTVLAKLFGGQGTINAPSWAPDSTQLAFVSYQYLP